MNTYNHETTISYENKMLALERDTEIEKANFPRICSYLQGFAFLTFSTIVVDKLLHGNTIDTPAEYCMAATALLNAATGSLNFKVYLNNKKKAKKLDLQVYNNTGDITQCKYKKYVLNNAEKTKPKFE